MMKHIQPHNQASDSDADTPSLSKTQRKNQMLAVQRLGERLVELDTSRLRRIELPETLRTAVLEAKKITAHGGRRRQLQYIGKLMRQVDFVSIEQQLQALLSDSTQAVALMHRCERLREALLADDAALTQFIAQYPIADIQQLHTLIRSARQEQAKNSAVPKHARALYRYLFQTLSGHTAHGS